MNFITRLFADIAINISNGKATTVKGKLMRSTMMEITSLCRDYGIAKGEIWINSVGKVTFSSHIPKKLHQKVRNILS